MNREKAYSFPGTETFDENLLFEIKQSLADYTGSPLEAITDEQIEAYLEQLANVGRPAEGYCVVGFIEQQAQAAPATVAAVCGDQSLTYASLNRYANQVAHRLLEQGMGAGAIVGICMERSLERVTTLLAVLKAGAVCLPLDPGDSPAHLSQVLSGAGAAQIVTQERFLSHLGAWREHAICIESVQRLADDVCPDAKIEIAPHDPAYLFADGLVGSILVSHQRLAGRLQWLQEQFSLSDQDALLHLAPLALDSSLWEILWPLAYGGRLVIADPAQQSAGAYLAEMVAAHGISILHLTPTQLDALLQFLDTAPHPSPISLHCVLCSGEPLKSGLVEMFFRHFKASLYYLYGPPEAATYVAAYPCEAGVEQAFIPIGYPAGTMPVYLLDKNLQPVPLGVPGEICLASDDFADGFLNHSPKAQEYWVANPFAATGTGKYLFRTGDMGRWLNDGSIEWSLAPARHIWLKGFRLRLQEMENALRAHRAVADCVILVKKAENALQLVAYFVPTATIAADQLNAHLRASFPLAVLPDVYLPISVLPLTNVGQVDESALARLEVIDAQLVARWEKTLQALPEIDQAAVVIQDRRESFPALHLSDLLPDWHGKANTAGAPGVDTAAQEKAALPPSERLAVSHGAELPAETGLPQTLPAVLQRAVHQAPAEGVHYLHPDGRQDLQTYPALFLEANRILAGLQQLGLQPGDKVLFQMSLNQDFIPSFWACLLGGLVPVPISLPTIYAEANGAAKKLLVAWELLSHPLILAGSALAPRIRDFSVASFGGRLRVAVVDELRATDPSEDWHTPQADDIAVLFLTSGSTGMPKIVALRHQNIIASMRATAWANRLTKDDISLNWMPLDHPGPLVRCMLRSTWMACRQLHAETDAVLQNPLQWLDWIDAYRVTHTWAPNFAFALLNDHAEAIARRSWDLACLQACLNTAEAIVAKTAQRFLELLAPHGLRPAAMQSAWGMAETCSGITFADGFLSNTVKIPGAAYVDAGLPVPGVSLRIVDGQGQIACENVIGRLQVHGATVMRGYYQNDALNADAFTADGWFQTGDLGFLKEGHLFITGREKDVVIIHGANYYNHEIEAMVEEVEGVNTSFTAACAIRLSARNTDSLAVFFNPTVADDQALIDTIKAIRERLVKTVGIYPDFVIPVDAHQIPKTSLGKIQRAQLSQRLMAGEFDEALKKIDILLANARTLPPWFYRKTWRRKDAQRYVVGVEQACTLVFLDSLGLGEALCTRLSDRGDAVIRVERGSQFARLASGHFCIDPGRPEHYRQLVREISDQNVARILHLWTYERPTALDELAQLEQVQAHGLYSVLYLVQAFANQAQDQGEHPIQLYLVSSHAQTLGSDDETAYQHATLLGLNKTIPQEIAWLSTCHIDLALDDIDADLADLLQELQCMQADREVAYRNRQRWVPRLERVDFAGMPTRDPILPGGMYLLTGGLGGIGREIASYLLVHYQARLILVGQTPLPGRDAWATGEYSAAVAERIGAYQALEQLGGELVYEAADIGDLTRMQQIVAQARQRWQSELAGVIHLAGVYREHELADETCQTFSATLHPKVAGAWVLSQLLGKQNGGLFVSFSSLVGHFGGAMVGAYACANSFLDAFNSHLLASGLQAYNFAWGMWDETGISQGYGLKEALRARGHHIFTREQGINALRAGLSHAEPALFIGIEGENAHIRHAVEANGYPLQRLAAYFSTRGDLPLPASRLQVLEVFDRFGTRSVCDFVQQPSLPLTESGAVDRQQLAALQAHARQHNRHVAPRTDLEKQIAVIWQEILGLQRVGVDDNFFELGGDSILAIQVIAKANRAGLELTPKQLFEHTTIAALAAATGSAVAVRAEQGVVTGPVPLIPVQHWFFDLNMVVPSHFNQAYMFRIRQDIRPEIICQAVRHLLMHHDALRLRFSKTPHGWQQFNAGLDVDGEVPFTTLDFSTVPASQREAEIEAAATRLQTSLDLSDGPLMRVALFQLGGDEPNRLLILIHHLAIDGISWRIILEDLYTLSQQLLAGAPVQLLPKTTAFKHWAETLIAYGQSEDVYRELPYWLAEPRHQVQPLPRDMDGIFTFDSVSAVSVSLNAAETRRLLQELPKIYHTQINDVLLTAVWQACTAWTGAEALLIDLVGHGREPIFEHVDVSRTVGWISSTFPLLLVLPQASPLSVALKSVQTQLQRVPNHGLGYRLLYYGQNVEACQKLRALPQPQIVFSYTGQFDQTLADAEQFELDRGSVGQFRDGRGVWPYWLDIYAHVVDGRLNVNWLYSEAIHHRSTIEKVANSFVAALHTLLAVSSPQKAGE